MQEGKDDRRPRTTDEGGPIHRVGAEGALSSTGTTSTTDPHQPSALGGEVSTRSAPGDADEKDGKG